MLSSDWILEIETENGALKISGYGLTAYHIKRERLQQAKSIPELKQCGIYFLYGETEEGGFWLRNIYVGKASGRENGEGIWQRIYEHRDENYWTEAIAFVNVNANSLWGLTEVSYLERYFLDLLSSAKKDSKLYVVQNKVKAPSGDPTQKVKKKCKEFINEVTTILETLRYDFFKEEKAEQALLDFSAQQKPISSIRTNVPKSVFSSQKDNKREQIKSDSSFKEYLKKHLKKNTASNYASSFKLFEEKLLLEGIISSSFETCSHQDLNRIRAYIAKNKDFYQYNKNHHYSPSAAWAAFEKFLVSTEKKQSSKRSASQKRVQMRNKKATKAVKTNFTVTFPDGAIIHEKSAAETLAKTINLIGPQKVAKLSIRAGGGELVSREGSSKYSNYHLDDGFILISHSSTDDKIRSLKKISKELNLSLIINKTSKPV